MTSISPRHGAAAALALALLAAVPATAADAVDSAILAPVGVRQPSYADLADLALPAGVVARAQVRKAQRLKPAQAPGLPGGMARLYVEAKTLGVLFGPALGESLRFLADVPLDARGKLPRLSRSQVLVLANPVAGKPGELQLVAPDAMIAWSPASETRLRAILTEQASAEAPPRVTAVREALHVNGNLAGEGETQVFLATEGNRPASLSILRRPGQPPAWGVSFSEIVDQAARPPAPETLGWYRLACALPPVLPRPANIAGGLEDRRIAAEDYALVIRDLGPCTRTRGGS